MTQLADAGPRSCIRCRQVEPNSYLLDQNHGGNGVPFWRDGMCTAQYLTRNHVSYHTARLGHPILPNRLPTYSLTGSARSAEVERLRNSIERASLLWAHRQDAGWLDAARQVLVIVNPEAPDHHQVQVSDDDVELFNIGATA